MRARSEDVPVRRCRTLIPTPPRRAGVHASRGAAGAGPSHSARPEACAPAWPVRPRTAVAARKPIQCTDLREPRCGGRRRSTAPALRVWWKAMSGRTKLSCPRAGWRSSHADDHEHRLKCGGSSTASLTNLIALAMALPSKLTFAGRARASEPQRERPFGVGSLNRCGMCKRSLQVAGLRYIG